MENNTFDLGNLKVKLAKPNLVYVLLNDIEQLNLDKIIFDIFLATGFLFLGTLFSNFSWGNLFCAGLGLFVAGVYLIKMFNFYKKVRIRFTRNRKQVEKS